MTICTFQYLSQSVMMSQFTNCIMYFSQVSFFQIGGFLYEINIFFSSSQSSQLLNSLLVDDLLHPDMLSLLVAFLTLMLYLYEHSKFVTQTLHHFYTLFAFPVFYFIITYRYIFWFTCQQFMENILVFLCFSCCIYPCTYYAYLPYFSLYQFCFYYFFQGNNYSWYFLYSIYFQINVSLTVTTILDILPLLKHTRTHIYIYIFHWIVDTGYQIEK